MNPLDSFAKKAMGLRDSITALAADRNYLQEKLKYTISTIAQLEAQNQELSRLLAETQAKVNSIIELVPTTNLELIASLPPIPNLVPGTSWIRGTWLSSPPNESFLIPIESAWQEGHSQHALNLLSLAVKSKDITSSQWVEATLIFSAIIRSAGDPRRALPYVEAGLSVATLAQLHDLVGKAHFHQGLCYLHLERYADARWCFVLAAHTAGHEELIDINTRIAEQKISELPPHHAGRKLGTSTDLNHFKSCIGDLDSSLEDLWSRLEDGGFI